MYTTHIKSLKRVFSEKTQTRIPWVLYQKKIAAEK